MVLTRWAIAAIAIVAWTINLPGQDNKSSALTEHKENDGRSQWVFFQYVGDQTPAPKTASADTQPPHWYTLPEWWLFILGVPTLFVFGWQAFETRRAAEATRDSVDLMERQAEEARGSTAQQTRDVQASIAEATRAATAMEGVAESMASNVQSLQESLAISKEIAKTQQLALQTQSRAYISVVFTGASYQDGPDISFEAQAILRNDGNTPASGVVINAVARIVRSPLPMDFDFPLPDFTEGVGSVSLVTHGVTKLIKRVVPDRAPDAEVVDIKHGIGRCLAMWGIVTYTDVFGKIHKTKFAFTVNWIRWAEGDLPSIISTS
jgi:hypothetical protein